MKVIKRGMWPGAARRLAEIHDKLEHGGEPHARVERDEESRAWAPKYKVWCPICKEEDSGTIPGD